MSHTLLSLNYDVLSQVLQLLSPTDAAQLALASRAAYVLAFPRIVSDVTLGGLYHKPGGSALSQLTNFCNLLLAPAPAWHGVPSARLDALQGLSVMRDAVRVRKAGVWTVDPSAAALLSSVIARASNLQRLTIWGSDALFAAYPDFCINSSSSIRTLILGGDVPGLPILARAFPHVRAVEFIAGSGSCAPDWALFTDNDAGDAHAVSPWHQKLDRVETGFPILPLACPVRQVALRNPLVSDTYELFCAREFLRRTRPVVLSASASAHLTEEEMCAVLDGEVVAPGLRFLELVGDRCDGVKDGSEWMTHVANTLSTLQVPLLGVALSVTPAIPSMPVFSSLKPSYEPAPAPTVAEEPADLAALARTVAEHAPSLQFIALDISGAPGAAKDAQAWFRAYSAGSERKVVKVEETEGRATMRKMLTMNRWD
ncbi:uncharacterized protein TRAVEDRAFT_39007 [Trametes versicolor FP-101664 SS1]|uniref:uncharacterized protein n=1 Tax=Trametes versicolor (strain FP-101664) TaxID=717944 RepID=UPI0004621C47|nr:uncharacterized protein TRAVEDRAFT_39007 [Trametes versicolor FP-101664 SS1]EIW55865.1 hypothetical protein TRAVEDRAFT_39007 [Trametes versicolor FP-101664 SS1]